MIVSGRWPWVILILGLLGCGVAIYWAWEDWLEHSQDAPIRAAALRYGVEPTLVKAIVWRESHFHPRVRGRAKELGLMQLQEEAAQEWADAERIAGFQHEHCLDPVTNTMAGAFYMKKLLRRYAHTDNPLPYALADYNAGRGNVLKWTKGAAGTNSMLFTAQIGFPGTRDYVAAVIQRYEKYRATEKLD